MTSAADNAPALQTGTLTDADVVHRIEGLAARDVPGGRVIVVPGAEPVTLSPSAAAIYDAIDGVRSIAGLAGPVAQRFQVAVTEVEVVTLPTVRRFGALGLLANVSAAMGTDVAPPPEPPVVAPPGPADHATEMRRLAEESDCVAQRFDLDRATFYSVRTPRFEIGLGAAGEHVRVVVESLLGEFLVDTPLQLGLMLVAPDPEQSFVEPVATIFDGSGYRAWRGRGDAALRSYLLALLSPLDATADYPRCFVDYRSLARDGSVILVHPYVLDDVRLMIECRRSGWEPMPRLYTELHAETGRVILREPFDPAAPGRAPEVQATFDVVGIHYGLSPGPAEAAAALESLVRRHLAFADGLSVEESLPILGDIVSQVPGAVAQVPGGRAYLQSFRHLVAQVQGAQP